MSGPLEIVPQKVGNVRAVFDDKNASHGGIVACARGGASGRVRVTRYQVVSALPRFITNMPPEIRASSTPLTAITLAAVN